MASWVRFRRSICFCSVTRLLWFLSASADTVTIASTLTMQRATELNAV